MSGSRRIGARLIRAFRPLFWWVAPIVVALTIVGYFGLAITRDVYPPAIPVEGFSMNPLLHVGDLVFIKHVDPETLKKGDIIAFQTSKAARQKYNVPARYVHRIIKVEGSGASIAFKTKGDNVPGPDPFITHPSDVIGQYAGHVPKLGYALLFIRSRQGEILGAALAVVFLLYIGMGYLDGRAEEREKTVLELTAAVAEIKQVAAGMAAVPLVRTPEPDVVDDVSDTKLRELVGAVAEYGEHLRSHTAVMKNLAATTADLRLVVSGLSSAPARGAAEPLRGALDRLVAETAALVEETSQRREQLRRSIVEGHA